MNNNNSRQEAPLDASNPCFNRISFIELLKLVESVDNEGNLIDAEEIRKSTNPQQILSKIEHGLQQSMHILKHYNGGAVVEETNVANDYVIVEENEDIQDPSTSSSSSVSEQETQVNHHTATSFNRNDFTRKNILAKSNNPTSTRRNSSIEHVAPPTTRMKTSVSQFDYNEIEKSARNELPGSSSSNWNYDELNELRKKFISLLASDTAGWANNSNMSSAGSNDLKSDDESSSTSGIPPGGNNNKRFSLDQNTEYLVYKSQQTQSKLQSLQIGNNASLSNRELSAAQYKPISIQDQLKIESFYQSFGTTVNTSRCLACLYTMPNSKAYKPVSDETLNTTTTVKRNRQEIDHDILNDFLHNRQKSYVSVYHRGVPLWLFNSGKNPRRPNKQLKFTLAEKGTGFILWQDRIDSHSNFRIYGLSKLNNQMISLSEYFDELDGSLQMTNQKLDSVLITFKASDKKTTVFLKFDLSIESLKFYEYYKQVSQNQPMGGGKSSGQTLIKEKTKSLPAGLGNVTSQRKYAKQYLAKSASTSTGLRCRKITKKEISPPCNLKHIINITSQDRDVYYTLSKLLPEALTVKSGGGGSTSPSYSMASSKSFSIMAENTAINLMNKPISPTSSTSSSKSSCLSGSSSSSSSSSSAYPTTPISCSMSTNCSNPISPIVKINNNAFSHKKSDLGLANRAKLDQKGVLCTQRTVN